jgi:hypothetical protein
LVVIEHKRVDVFGQFGCVPLFVQNSLIVQKRRDCVRVGDVQIGVVDAYRCHMHCPFFHKNCAGMPPERMGAHMLKNDRTIHHFMCARRLFGVPSCMAKKRRYGHGDVAPEMRRIEWTFVGHWGIRL